MLSRVRAIFHHPGLRKSLVRIRIPLALVAAVAVLPLLRRDWLLWGFVVSTLGQAIQIWSFASLDKNSDLAIQGPYAFVRNPMYLGRFLIILGFVMLLASPWVLLAYAVVYWFYMEARVSREERKLRPIFGARYDEYCAKVRRFVPGLPLRGSKVAYWSWTLFRRNHALRNFAGALALWAVFAGWLLFRK